jgi:hypothetical protein
MLGLPGTSYVANTSVVVITSEANEGFQRARNEFHRHGFDLNSMKSHKINYGDFGYTLILCHVMEVRGFSEPLVREGSVELRWPGRR